MQSPVTCTSTYCTFFSKRSNFILFYVDFFKKMNSVDNAVNAVVKYKFYKTRVLKK